MRLSSITRVRNLLPKEPVRDVFFFVICSVIAWLTIIEPIVLSQIIDNASNNTDALDYYMIICVVMIFLIRSGLSCWKKSEMLRYRNKCILELSSKMVGHLLRCDIRYFEIWTPAYLVSRVIEEPANIDGVLLCCVLDSLISILICLVSFSLMVSKSWVIAILTLLFVGTDYYIAFKLPLTKVYKAYNETQAQVKSRTANMFQGIREIKMGLCYDDEEKNFKEGMKDFLETLFKKSFFSQVQRQTSNICRQFGYLLVIVISAVLISNGEIGIGDLTMLLSLYNLLWSHTGAAENLIPMYKYGKVTCDRIMEVLSAESEICGYDEKCEIGEIRLDGVSFSYRQDQPVLQEITLAAKRGNITCLAGYSGCGKSTIISILLGMIRHASGKLLVNEKEVTTESLVNMRTRVGYVSQEGFLFNRSIRDNLLYYAENNADNLGLLHDYLKRFSLDTLVGTLPNGLDTILGNSSSTISGGERQRFCLIRELMKKPSVLILDEGTSHLDIAIEKLIFDTLREMSSNMIVIQIAHRPSALLASDIIYLLDEGKVVASGSYEELQKKSDYFERLLSTMRNNDD